MIYQSGHIIIYADHPRIKEKQFYTYHKYRPRTNSQADQVKQELKEFRERWLEDVNQFNEIFEAGEEDLLFPTKQCCECGKNHTRSSSAEARIHEAKQLRFLELEVSE